MESKTIAWGVAAGSAATLAALWRIRRRTNLEGKCVFITGGSRGLGLVLARELLAQGARVAICARDADEVARADLDLRAYGRDVVSIVCDVTERDDVTWAIKEVESCFAPIDVLINNAGIIQIGPMESMSLADYQEAMRVHFFGPLHTTLAVLPSMKTRGSGHIVNISSIGGKVAVPHMLPYSASKFALVGFTEGLRAEAEKHGIAVTSVAPGLMRTGSAPRAQVRGREEAEYAWFSAAAAMPLLSMSAERAARKIIAGIRSRKAEVVVGLPAKAAAKLHALAPKATMDLLALFDRHLLPEPLQEPLALESGARTIPVQ
jgi:short-subunit dehydrogenase